MANLKCIPEDWYQLTEGQIRVDKLDGAVDSLLKYNAIYKIIENEGLFYIIIPMSVHEEHVIESSFSNNVVMK